MASTAMFTLYASWGQYNENPVVYDEDNSVSLSSFRRLELNQQASKSDSPPPSLPPPESEPESTEIPSKLNETSSEQTGKDINDKVNNTYYSNGLQFNIDKNLPAVEALNAKYSFGLGKNSVIALREVNLTVPAGGIYGLLGPSGCGKTTLLRCMVGQLKPDSGKIKVFGFSPGSRGSLVPGPGIGYMPQELALFPDFTIEETLVYFGRLYRMESSHVRERIAFLLKFLDMPAKERMVCNLSGGQKRRVSLAAALVHNPPLLILDEPTVGVDPVLRQAIWDHLVSLTKDGNLTVLITTHYIEEARAANMVGLMRFGRLLTEATPEFLLKHFDSPTLEEVFLKLCQIDVSHDTTERLDKLKRKRFALKNKPDICSDVIMNGDAIKNGKIVDDKGKLNKAFSTSNEAIVEMNVNNEKLKIPKKCKDKEKAKLPYNQENLFENLVGSLSRTSALFHKNLIRLRRNLPVLMFQFLLPSIEVILFCVCIGRDPFNLNVAVVNEERYGVHGKSFLKSIDSHTIQQGVYNTSDDAIQAVKDGHSWAAIVVGENFSYALTQRALQGPDVSNETIEQSEIKVHLDMTNQIIAYQLQRTLLESFQKFARGLVDLLDISPAIAELPVKISKPVYGDEHPTFTEFMAPGVLLSIAFLAAVALTALAFVLERKEGLLERSLVAGVTSHEFLLSHVLTQLLVLFVQVTFLLVFTFAVFKIPSRGSFVWVIALTFLQGACGMSYGLMISAICKEENSATMLALGSFYPNLLLSGTVWPTQAMPLTMRYVSYLLPQTLPVESMRYILSRGWDITYPEVALGFGVTILWSLFFLLAAVVIFKYKK